MSGPKVWDPRENPLVERAFRIGFRRGPVSFRLGWYIAGLALATIGPFLPAGLDPNWTVRDAAGWMLPGLLALLLLVFVVGGFQRMLASFSQERERGTFDFLHLSTLRSDSIVLGFLLAGQLPGYLALVLLSPLLALSAFLSGFPLATLAALLASMVFTVLVFSILFLFLGFWAKKVSEFRGAAFVYAIMACFGGWAVAGGLVRGGVLPDGAPQALLGAPVITGLFSYGMQVADEGSAIPPATIDFCGATLPAWLYAMVVLLPVAAIVYLALCRALRHRDRSPWSTAHATLLFSWGVAALVGTWWGTGIPLRMRSVALAVFAWIAIRRLLERGTPTRAQTVHALGRTGGDVRALLAGEEGPPLRLALALIAAWWGGSLLLAAEAVLRRSSVETLSPSGSPLLFALAPALFLAPLAVFSLAGQSLAWRAPRWRWMLLGGDILFVLGPFIAFLFGPKLAELPYFSAPFLATYGALSPFSQLISLARGAAPEGFSGALALLGQIPCAIALLLLLGDARGALRELAARSRRLLAGLDGAPGEPPTPPAGAALGGPTPGGASP